MPGDYIPSTDNGLMLFSAGFLSAITGSPADFGLVAGDVTALTALDSAYSSALTAATDPSTRTKTTVAAKDTARGDLIAELRLLANKVQATPTVTDAQKATLGITVRDPFPTPIPAPVTYPLLSIVAGTPLAHQLRYADSATPAARKKPVGAATMELRCTVSATPIASPDALDLRGLYGKNPVAVEFGSGDVGKQAYYAARWVNPRGQVGPWSAVSNFTVAA